MPSLSQPFRLALLPRIASLSSFSAQTGYLKVADDLVPTSNKITIGISESAISQYILNPTPKLVFNIPIPSTNIVTACDVAQLYDQEGLDENDENLPLEIWCYSLKAGKSNTLNVAIKKNYSDNLIISSGESPEENKIKVKDQVVGIKIIIKDKTIVVLLKSGLICFYDFQLKLLHSFDISYGDIGVVNYFNENSKDFMFVLCSLKDNKVCFKLFELSLKNNAALPVKELSSTILEDFSLAESKICYQSGKLYRLSGDQILTYSLPQCQLVQTIKIPMISASQVISMKPISTNRVLLTVNNKIYLLDLIHNSILSERELTHVKTFQLLKSAVINSHIDASNPDKRTIAIGVATKHGTNPTSSLEIINVDVGTGTLKDSLGKSFQISNKAASHALKPLFAEENEDDERDFEEFDYDKIYQQLVKNKNSISNFDSVFLKLNIKKEHYTEKDRFVCDQEFFSKVLHLIFNNFEEEYPRALTFLLTHPLFPMDCTTNLLSRFREHPRLFKQAIVTCPNLPLQELLSELFSMENGELSLDISLRILQDYTTDMIKQEMKKLSKVDIQNFIDFIITSSDEETVRNSRQLFQLLSLVLDSIGLLALEESLLNRLSDYIDRQVTIAERNSKLWFLVDGKHTARDFVNSSSGITDMQKEAMPRYTVEYLDL